ncbi:glycosyltransferase family 2 protein [Alisedimentitalea sp. MJ-SS2]|uniref:glycosyltransferase family 2 protein n=1 Tax=Aliisedimentitalea sp. MJ-SS2 TaxID=3049795 RepID=UPI0029115E88|nr:glycosyltransferase family 2 protein [Alisedimentitalea sp. MJ-SS2]MDU8928288.1 glycosyltransferase family 2 protein [Alisedimentitalea sp. MJ-SS2]
MEEQMVKLVIQIPCYNEAAELPDTLAALPHDIPGVDVIETLVIDDGSTDGTTDVARSNGVNHVIRHRRNRGLAMAFQSGLEAALAIGADIIVNTDADGQYEGEDIAELVAPIVTGKADIVVGDRGVASVAHFHPVKRWLQRLGSAVVRQLSGVAINDAVSGFRAMSREAAQRITITSSFSYTTDMLIQAGRKRMAITSVPIRSHPTERPSRLFKSIPGFISRTLATMLRAYATYNPLRTFAALGALMLVIGLAPIIRFLWFWLNGDGSGHVQSLVLGGALLVLGVITCLMAILADLIGANRKLIETTLEHVRRLEEQSPQKPCNESPKPSLKSDVKN